MGVPCHLVGMPMCVWFTILALISVAVHRMSRPTYQELIQLLNEAERDQSDVQSTAELLAARFRDLYPHISICRPGRFLETVGLIAGPIRNGKLKEPSCESYLKKHWIPRTRNTGTQGMQLYTN